MQTLEGAVEEMGKILWDVPPGDVRRLERALKRLTPEQKTFACNALERAKAEKLCHQAHLNQLEYAVESWWAHSLATKLGVVGCLVRLSESNEWPDAADDASLVRRTLDRGRWAALPGEGSPPFGADAPAQPIMMR